MTRILAVGESVSLRQSGVIGSPVLEVARTGERTYEVTGAASASHAESTALTYAPTGAVTVMVSRLAGPWRVELSD